MWAGKSEQTSWGRRDLGGPWRSARISIGREEKQGNASWGGKSIIMNRKKIFIVFLRSTESFSCPQPNVNPDGISKFHN